MDAVESPGGRTPSLGWPICTGVSPSPGNTKSTPALSSPTTPNATPGANLSVSCTIFPSLSMSHNAAT